MSSERERVIQALRATLISVKGALTIEQCNRDYKELEGKWIPYKQLGYPTLESLFVDVPGFSVSQRHGQWYVDAIATQETAHIVDMVSKQKSSKKSVKSNYNRFPKKQGSWRKPIQSCSSYSSNYNSQYSNQYYRAKVSTPYNNYNSVKYSYSNKYTKPSEMNSVTYPGKPSEMKTTTYPAKPMPKPTVENKKPTSANTKPTSENTKPTSENTKPTSENTKPTSENTKPSSENKKQTSENTRPSSENSKPSNENSKPSTKTYKPPQVLREVNTVVDEMRHSIQPVVPQKKPAAKISASERLSNLRERINDSMNSIPLQMPAANNDCVPVVNNDAAYHMEHLEPSGPVAHVAVACSLEPPPDSTSAIVKLEWTCMKLGLPQPVYKIHTLKPKRGPLLYDCNCKVGTYSGTSYPNSSPTEELSREMAAVKVLAMVESSQAGGLPTSTNGQAIAGLVAIVAEHEAGVWANIVPHLYRGKYNENLPSNWQDLVENCPQIIKEKLVNGLVLLPNTEEATRPLLDISIVEDAFSIDSELPPLQFPDDDFWNVFVTVANSTLEIWLRIIGTQYSDALENMLQDMATYYEREGTLVDKSMLIKNAWYAVNLEDGGWQRAKILELDEELATVFLGDHGDEDVVEMHCIKILEPQFRKLPAQAILCRLEGAEELSVSEEGASLVQKRLPGEALVAAPGPRTDPADPSVALVLYDTSTARDLNLNIEIVHDFCIKGAFTITQKLCEVTVGCVTDEGRVWVVRPQGAELVSRALTLLTAGAYRRPLPAAPPAPPAAQHTLYIVKTLAGEWVRCVMISGVDGEGTVRTQLVDSGLVLRAPLSSLVPLLSFSAALAAFPFQALQVRLGPAERAAGAMAGRLRELLLGEIVLCRALPPSPAAPSASLSAPNVELFVRTGEQRMMASVNNSILMEYEYRNQNKSKSEARPEPMNHVEALHRRKERIFRSSSLNTSVVSTAGDGKGAAGTFVAAAGALPPPALPPVGDCFDVFIAMAANPWNFVVQPNSTRHQLQTMMAALQTECPKLSEKEAPTGPASGELYTVYYDKDNSWYRVLIAGCVSSDMVSVYFCDYGDLDLFANSDLRPVPAGAPLARSLPPQAIKAKLYDVFPLHQDWSVEDCIRFQELCVEQQFVGICKEVGQDPLNPSEPLLTLDLIDTSTDEDIYLNKQLVTEGRVRLGTAT